MPDTLDGLKATLQDRYIIQRELGRGGSAVVCLADGVEPLADGSRGRSTCTTSASEANEPNGFGRPARSVQRSWLQKPHT
jgi:hypothetical protein